MEPNKNNIFIIGDSHVTFFERAGFMRSHWTGPIHIVTIYQLLQHGLMLGGLKEQLSKSDHFVNVGVFPWQCPSGVYDVPNISEGDVVLFSFGFNDIQKNIYKYAASNPKDEILKLIHGYIDLLIQYKNKYKITCIPCSIPPNPSIQTNHISGPMKYGIGGEFEANGSCDERNTYTLYANDRLRKSCAKINLQFFDLYNEISDADGFLKKEYTEDYVHLRHDNAQLNDLIQTKLKTLLNQ